MIHNKVNTNKYRMAECFLKRTVNLHLAVIKTTERPNKLTDLYALELFLS